MVDLSFPRIREYFNFIKNPSRYRPDDDEEVDLSEETDPSTWRDQTKPTWKERLASRKRQVAAFGFLGVVILGVLAAWTHILMPSLTGNIWLQRAVVTVVAVPSLVLGGMRLQRSKLKHLDWVILIGPKRGVSFYLARYDGSGEASFQAVKGFDFGGLRGRKLQLRDLEDDFAQAFAKRGRKPDDPANIRIEDARYHVQETMMGRVVGVVTSGIKVDGYSESTDLYCAPPDMADEETYKELVRTLSKTKNRVKDLEEQNEALEEERDEWKELATERREDVEDHLTDLVEDVAKAGFIQHASGRYSRNTGSNQDNTEAES